MLDKEDGTFTAEYLSMNDIPQSELLLLTLIDKAFSQYEEKHNITVAENESQEPVETETEAEPETTRIEETSEGEDYTDSDLTGLIIASPEVVSNYIQKNDFSSQGNTEYGQCWSNGDETVNITVSDGMIMSLSIYSGSEKSLFGITPGVTSYQSAAEMLLDCEFVFIYDESPTWSIFRSAYDEEVWVYHKDDGIVSGIGYTPFIMGE